jgi:hypothetical protein
MYLNEEKSSELGRVLFDLLTTLRAMYVHYQNLHWESQGQAFYSDHLLYQRLYGGVAEETDALAEKILGLTGDGVFVSDIHTFEHGYNTLRIWYDVAKGKSSEDRALFSEFYLLEQLEYTSAYLGELGAKSLGLEDFLSGLASKHEEHIYLLRQRNGFTKKRQASAAHLFFDNPQAREVREFSESGALSNNPESAETFEEELRAEIAPPNPSEIIEDTAGADEFSTLSRFIVETEQPVEDEANIPQGYDDVDKADDVRLKQGRRKRLTWR